MRILDRDQVIAALPMADCIAAMTDVLAAMARGETLQPQRQVIRLPNGRDLFGVMPGYVAQGAALGVKVIAVFAPRPGRAHDSHQGAVLLFDGETGVPVAVVDARAITAIRTAAVSAVATNLLARADSRVLALLGSGTQARSHLAAMLAVRPIERARVWSPTVAHAERFAAEESARHDIPVEVAPDVAAAVRHADVVCTVTAAREPILSAARLAPGVHVNAVGASTPAFRELATDVYLRATVVTDRRESLAQEAGDYQAAVAAGMVDPRVDVTELGEILVGRRPGRSAADEITLFRSLGLAVEDLAAARLVYERCLAAGLGTEVAW